MSELLITNAKILTANDAAASVVLIRDGVIAAVACDEQGLDIAPSPEAERVDAGGRLLMPGLIDLHVHGVENYLFERSVEDLAQGLATQPKYGVTSTLPTLYTVMNRESLPQLEALGNTLGNHRNLAPGFHLEGPFLKLPGAGAATVPGDVGLLDEVLAAAQHVAAMSISPDTPGILPVIERLMEQDIVAYITHTRASVEETEAAIDAGARHATHFYDVFPLPDETDPGARPVGCVEAILADPRVSVDFIADGVHVHPTAIRAALAAKGPGNVILITDANIGAGLGDGIYDTPWGYPVRVSKENATRIESPGQPKHGTLAGSCLTMPRAIANAKRWLNLSESDVWSMATSSPAQRMNWSNKGHLKQGQDADLVLWNNENSEPSAYRTWSRGRVVFDATQTPELTP